MEGHFDENAVLRHGTWAWADGSVYEGNFVDRMLHGRGGKPGPDGSIYEGEFRHGHGTMHGVGRVVWDGQVGKTASATAFLTQTCWRLVCVRASCGQGGYSHSSIYTVIQLSVHSTQSRERARVHCARTASIPQLCTTRASRIALYSAAGGGRRARVWARVLARHETPQGGS